MLIAAQEVYSLYQVQSVLQHQGYDTCLAPTNIEILLQAQQLQPSLILVDLELSSVELPDLLPMLRCYPSLAAVQVCAFAPPLKVTRWRTRLQDPLCLVASLAGVTEKLINMAGLMDYFEDGSGTMTGATR